MVRTAKSLAEAGSSCATVSRQTLAAWRRTRQLRRWARLSRALGRREDLGYCFLLAPVTCGDKQSNSEHRTERPIEPIIELHEAFACLWKPEQRERRLAADGRASKQRYASPSAQRNRQCSFTEGTSGYDTANESRSSDHRSRFRVG